MRIRYSKALQGDEQIIGMGEDRHVLNACYGFILYPEDLD